MDHMEDLRFRLARSGAALLAVGMLTGIWSAAALTGKVVVAIPRLALAAHLNALLGSFWLLGLAFTLPMLRYGDAGRRRLVRATQVPAWGNWLITLIASFLGVRGLEYTSDRANNAIALALQVVVVLPSLACAIAWALGFGRHGPAPKVGPGARSGS
jgi:hydroxylaminobenzene mutase